MLGIETLVDANTATVKVDGKLTVLTAPELEEAIGAIDASVSNIVIDLQEVTYVASAGLRVFVATQRLASSRGGTMTIAHPCDDVYEVLEMTGLATVLNIER